MWILTALLVIFVFTTTLASSTTKGGYTTPGKTYCVKADGSETCPDPCCTPDTCHTLTDYAVNKTFETSNATFLFLPGVHWLYQIVSTRNASNITLRGALQNSTNLPTIRCFNSTQNGLGYKYTQRGLIFSYTSNLKLENLKVMDCNFCNKWMHPKVCNAVEMHKVTNLTVNNVVITNTTSGSGLKLINVYGHSVINNTLVQYTNGTMVHNFAFYCYNDSNYDNKSVSHLLIENSTFQYGNSSYEYYRHNYSNEDPSASGFFIHIKCDIRMNITLKKVRVIHNTVWHHFSGGNIAIFYLSYSEFWLIKIKFVDCLIANGSGSIGGGMYFDAMRIPGGKYYDGTEENTLKPYSNISSTVVPILTVIGTQFIENKATYGAGVYIRFRETKWPTVAKISFINCSFEKQMVYHKYGSTHGGVAIHARSYQLPVYIPHNRPLLKMELTNCNFSKSQVRGKAFSSPSYAAESHSGTLYVQSIDSVTLTGTRFVENNCTGIVAIKSVLQLSGVNNIHNNTGVRGGGMVLCSRSIIFLHKGTLLNITENRAKEFGGGIYVESECDQDIPHCFFQVNNTHNRRVNDTRLALIHNHALAGKAIYGGIVDHCIVYMNSAQNYTRNVTKKVFNETFHIEPEGFSFISSNPSSVCFCPSELYNGTCNKSLSKTIVPGSEVRVKVMLLGQRNGPSPGIVKAFIDCEAPSNCSITNEIKQTEQDITRCTTIKYRVYSSREDTSGAISLMVAGGSFEYSGTYAEYAATVHLRIEKCPLGSIINPSSGVCLSLLTPTNTKIHVTKYIESKSTLPVWVGYKELNPIPNSSQIIRHKFCPLGYCQEKPHGIKINTTYYSFDQDVQCAQNRTGLLCGKCKQNYSLGFGSSQCLSGCNTTEKYLQYLRVIGLTAVCGVAGILLVVLLTLLNLTVAEGTLNGLIFYANIVQVNVDIFFPSDTHARPWTAFIAWLNLDFGVTVCFYDGMDAYVKTWLQFIFPLYLWMLSGAIVYFSRKSKKIAKLAGKNAVKVLATLFLLSFGKLIRTVIASGFFTNVKSYDGSVNDSVWLLDANIHYLHGKHIVLFAFACFTGVTALLYALTLTFIQCLRRSPNSRMCGWVQRLKPLLDAYTGPYKDKYHFWTGLLLLVRIALFTAFALNTNSVPTLSFTVIVITCSLLLIAIQPGIYRNALIGYLESLMYINLILFSAIMTFLIGKDSKYRVVAAYCFGVVTLVKFMAIILYHARKELRGYIPNSKRFWRRREEGIQVYPVLIQRRGNEMSSEEEEDNEIREVTKVTCGSSEYREPLIN